MDVPINLANCVDTREMYSGTLEVLDEEKGNEKDVVVLQWGSHGGSKGKKTMLQTEGHVAGTVPEGKHATLVQEPLSKSFKREFVKKVLYHFYEC